MQVFALNTARIAFKGTSGKMTLLISIEICTSRVSLLSLGKIACTLHMQHNSAPNLTYSLDILARYLPLLVSRVSLLRSSTKSSRQQFPSCPSSYMLSGEWRGIWFPVSDVLAGDIRISQIPLETTALARWKDNFEPSVTHEFVTVENFALPSLSSQRYWFSVHLLCQ